MELLPLPEPYDFERSMYRYRRFGDDLASRLVDGRLHRVLRSGLPVRVGPEGVATFGEPNGADRAEIAHMLGAGFDLDDFAGAEPAVAALAPGFRPPLLPDPFEMLVTSVTAQQISLHAACAIRNRLVRAHGRRIERDGLEWWAFPRAGELRDADLEGLGLSRSKERSIRALAGADLSGLDALPDADVSARLTALPGIGRWTVDWFLARCLGRPHAFAAGDLGVRKAVARWFSSDSIWPEQRVREACLGFGRHANLAVHYLLVAPATA